MHNLSYAIALAALVASPAAAAPAVQTMIGAVGDPDASGAISIEAMVFNGGDATATVPVPPRIAAGLSVGPARTATTLERLADTPQSVAVPAGGFARVRYTLRLPAAGVEGQSAILSVPEWSSNGVAFALPEAPRAAIASTSPTAAPIVNESFESADGDTGNAFLRNLSAYEPIYAVYGPGTNSDARLQISFKYQLFGQGGALGTKPSVLDGLYFAFTQRIFWNLGKNSSPFRNVDYMPEAFYQLPVKTAADRVSFGGLVGLRHESNGRDGPESRSLNTVYIQPLATAPIGDYKLSVGPRVWAFTGSRKDNPDIGRYRGNTGLFAEFGRDDGLRISTTSRYNFGSGKGSINAEASYPLSELIDKKLNLYLIGQVFTGYGENLLDYNRRTNRARIGIGIVR